MKKVIVGVLLLIVFIILIFQIVGSSAGEIISAADSVSDANNCSDHTTTGDFIESGLYNFSTKGCYNGTTGGEFLYTAGQIDLPLNTLFGRSSVLLLVFMAAILLVALFTVIKGLKEDKK